MVKATESKRKSGPSASQPPSRARLRLFKLILLLVPPLVLPGVIEVGLRLGGFGYPTSFFVRQKIDGADYYVTNERFGYRFFPSAIARTPFALRVPVKKGPNTFRIFVFGESAAQGDPDPTFGVSRYLEVLLQEHYPDTHFEVVCVAMTAINSHVVLPIARECGRMDGDLWAVYMGNNEMVGPFGAGTIFGPAAPPVTLVRASLAAKSLKVGQLLERMMSAVRSKNGNQKNWGGLSMFKEHQLRIDDPARLRAYRNFEANLRDMLSIAQKAKVPVVLSTVASNLKQCAPFGSLHRHDLSESQRADFDELVREGAAREKAGNETGAIESFAKAKAIDPQFAEIHYRLGTCQSALSNYTGASEEFILARDYDTLGFRADTRINETIGSASREAKGGTIHLLDACQTLAAGAAGGIPGEEQFYEHVHLTFQGNYQLARAFAEKIAGQLPASVRKPESAAWASGERCDELLAATLWDQHRLWQANFSRVSEPPFTEQLDDVPRARRYMARLEALRGRMTPAERVNARETYTRAIKLRPDDASLHGNFAQFLMELGETSTATNEQQRVCELLPTCTAAFHKAGLLLVRENKIKDAAEQFRHALTLRQDFVPAVNELALCEAFAQNPAKGNELFQQAIKANPGFPDTYLNRGFLFQLNGNLPAALNDYRQAAELQPGGPAAHFHRAVESAREKRNADAVTSFQAAVWMNPGFWQAHYLLGVELALAEKVEEAQAHFIEAVRLRPDFAKAHLNLGVAYAKQRKLDEALKEFKEAERLSPTNAAAKQNVEKLQGILRPHAEAGQSAP
jgi:tetratricopeptide (TPR) repeat protein